MKKISDIPNVKKYFNDENLAVQDVYKAKENYDVAYINPKLNFYISLLFRQRDIFFSLKNSAKLTLNGVLFYSKIAIYTIIF